MTLINAQIFTCEDKIIKNGYISFENGRITAIGTMKKYAVTGDEIDVSGKMIYPGFIDAHTHLGMWEDSLGFEGDDGNEETDPATPQLRALDAVNSFDKCFREALEGGVTAVVTGPGSANPIAGQNICVKTCGGRIDDIIVKSPIAMKMALGENPKTVYHGKQEAPYTRMATASIIREQLALAVRYMHDIEKSETDPDTDAPDFDAKLDALLPVVQKKLPVHFHAHRRDDIFTAIRIAEEFDLDYVIVHATEGHLCANELKTCGAKVMSGPFLCDRSKPELSNLSPASPGVMANSGIMTAIITDHPVIPLQYLPICAGLAVREGMSHDDAIKAITINPAKILGIDHIIGSLKVGKDADFSVYSQDPLSLFAKPEMVFVNGELKYSCNKECEQ